VANNDDWYPVHNKARAALVDEYLHNHHETTRTSFAGYFRLMVLAPLGGKWPSDAAAAKVLDNLRGTLDLFEKYWLAKGTPFINGFSKPTVADLNAYQVGKTVGLNKIVSLTI
jgi:hypothetical protein